MGDSQDLWLVRQGGLIHTIIHITSPRYWGWTTEPLVTTPPTPFPLNVPPGVVVVAAVVVPLAPVTITPLPTVTPVGVETVVVFNVPPVAVTVPPKPELLTVPPTGAAPVTITGKAGITLTPGETAADPLLNPPTLFPVTLTAPGVPGIPPGVRAPPTGPGAIVPPIGWPGSSVPPNGAGASVWFTDELDVAPLAVVIGVVTADWTGAAAVALIVVGVTTAGVDAVVVVVPAGMEGVTTFDVAADGAAAAARQPAKHNPIKAFTRELYAGLGQRERRLDPDRVVKNLPLCF